MLASYAQLYMRTLANIPPVPSVTPIYKTTVSTTTDETTSTFNSVDIGTPHPKRIIILACYHGVAAAATATVNGIDHYHRTQNTAHEFSMFAHYVPNGTTATITVSATSSIRKAVSVYVAYPENPMPLDSGTATANTGTNANVADMKTQASGFLIYSGGQHATLGTFTTTWNGTEAVTEDIDAQLESAASYTMGRITTITTSADLNDVNMAQSTSGTKRLVVTTWGPPRRQAG